MTDKIFGQSSFSSIVICLLDDIHFKEYFTFENFRKAFSEFLLLSKDLAGAPSS